MAATEPMFNVPRAVLVAALVMIAVQVVRGLLPDEIDITVLLALAFIPARYSGAAAELPGGYIACVTSFVTYMVVHGGWMHLLVNLLWMLAFGTAVARRIGARGFYEFSILCGIAGALTHLSVPDLLGGPQRLFRADLRVGRRIAGRHRLGSPYRWFSVRTPHLRLF